MNMMQDPNWDILMSVAEADGRARGEMFSQSDWDDIINKVAELKERFKGKQAIDKIKKVVNGRWVMEVLDIKGGKELGNVIKSTVEWIIDNGININNTDMIKDKPKIVNAEIDINTTNCSNIE